MPGSPPPAPSDYSPRRLAAFVLTLAATFVDLVDASVLNVALPALRADLHASTTQLEWAIAGYTLAFAAGLITGARLGDRLGRLRVFQVGLAAFTLASALTGAAGAPGPLIAARVAQGTAAALMVPQVLAMLRVEFPPEEQSRAATLYGLVFSVGGIGGPLLGGALLHADLFGLGWRPIFYVNVPIGVAALIGTAVLGRESRAERAADADGRGLVLSTAALLTLLFPLVEGRALDWPWWCVPVAALCPVLLYALLRHERALAHRGGTPLFEPALLRLRATAGGVAAATLFFAGTAYTLVLSVHLQTGVGLSPLRAALTMAPFAVGVGLFSPFATRLRPLGRRLAVLGSLVLAGAMGAVLVVVGHEGERLRPWHLAPWLLIGGVGMSMASGVLVATVLARTPARHAGAAAALVGTAIQVGVAAGVALVGTVYFGLLDAGHSPTEAAVGGLSTVVALYVLAAPAALVLPGGRLTFTTAAAEPPPLTRSAASPGR
ncbi:MFS transporter [Embleya sp. NPDC059237]|uniref:MFS transporter n=1 Tax=Embleya sp. NPDC059237 TaxID=3346784 RepID=UPI0036A289E8